MKRNTFRWLIFGMLFTVLCNVISIAQSSNDPVKGQQLFELAKQALGGETRLNEIQGLGLEGKINHPGQTQQQEEKLKLVFLSRTLVGTPNAMEEDINVNVVTGDSATKKKVVIINSDPSDSSKIENDKIMVFAGDPSKTGNETFQKRVIIKKDGEQSESSNSTVEKNVIVNIVGTHPMSGDIPNLAPPLDIAHSMIGLLLKSPTPLEVSYIGDGENGTADALSLKSKDGKSSVLYLDKATHFPVALNYSASEETMMFRVKKDGKISQEEAKALAKSTKSQEKQDITIRFSDRRLVDGVLLPYHITRTVNGQLKDEYQIEKYDLNPDFKVIELHKSK